MNRESNFYVLKSKGSNRDFVGKMARHSDFAGFRSAWRGQFTPSTPVEIVHNLGGKPKAIVWVGTIPVLSSGLIEAMSAEEATGWAAFPVRVYGKDGSAIPDYWGLSITGRVDSIRVNKSEVIREENHRGVQVPFRKGLEFDRSSWDGSDLFRGRDGATDFIVSTSKVRRLFELSKANASFQPTEDFMIRASEIKVRVPARPNAKPERP